MLKDTQQGHVTTYLAAAATSCVCLKIHSGKRTLVVTILLLDPSTVWNMNCSIQEVVATTATTYSPKSTTVEIHWLKIRLRVQFVTCHVAQQSWWFQQEHSVRTVGPRSTLDIWFQVYVETSVRLTAAATFAWTRHRKLQLAKEHKTTQWSTLLKSSVDHCHVQSTSAEGSWPALCALSDECLCTNCHAKLICFAIYYNCISATFAKMQTFNDTLNSVVANHWWWHLCFSFNKRLICSLCMCVSVLVAFGSFRY